jgi:putative phosphoribosyl transferase
VPVAAEVAHALDAPLDVLLVRKIGCPWQPELGVGAIAEGGIRVLDNELLSELGLDPADLETIIRREQAELDRRVRLYRGLDQPLPVAGRTAVLVDDGLATGSTAKAAIAALRARRVGRIILAVPVAPPSTIAALAPLVDEVVAVLVPERLGAIGQFYDDFRQTTDEEVIAALAASRRPDRSASPRDDLPSKDDDAPAPLGRTAVLGRGALGIGSCRKEHLR